MMRHKSLIFLKKNKVGCFLYRTRPSCFKLRLYHDLLFLGFGGWQIIEHSKIKITPYGL